MNRMRTTRLWPITGELIDSNQDDAAAPEHSTQKNKRILWIPEVPFKNWRTELRANVHPVSSKKEPVDKWSSQYKLLIMLSETLQVNERESSEYYWEIGFFLTRWSLGKRTGMESWTIQWTVDFMDYGDHQLRLVISSTVLPSHHNAPGSFSEDSRWDRTHPSFGSRVAVSNGRLSWNAPAKRDPPKHVKKRELSGQCGDRKLLWASEIRALV